MIICDRRWDNGEYNAATETKNECAKFLNAVANDVRRWSLGQEWCLISDVS